MCTIEDYAELVHSNYGEEYKTWRQTQRIRELKAKEYMRYRKLHKTWKRKETVRSIISSSIAIERDISYNIVRGERSTPEGEAFRLHVDAFLYARTQAENNVLPSVGEIEYLHSLLSPHGGKFRECDVTILGSQHKPPPSREVYVRVREWCKDVEYIITRGKAKNRSRDFAYLHRSYEQIHPHTDLNGRLGRILLNWMAGLVDPDWFIKLVPDMREEYLNALEAQNDKELAMLIEIGSIKL